MSQWVGVGIFVLAILAVVLIHESGHFFTAKAFGIKVEEFFVGFGPRLWSTRRGETEYGVKALPFGGYVRIAGMNPFEEVPEEERPRTFGAKPIWQRAIVIATGPVTHFVMAGIFLMVFFVAIGVPTPDKPNFIVAVSPTLNGQVSPAVQAGLRKGDQIVAVDGRHLTMDQTVDYTHEHANTPIRVTVLRDGMRLTVTVTPILAPLPDGSRVGRIGVDLADGRQRYNPIVAAGKAITQTGSTTKSVVLQLGDVFGPSGLKRIGQLLTGNATRRSNDATSIVGATRLAGEAAQSGNWDFLFGILVVFNIFVGILNLVPLPPLDGGHLAVLAYEKVRRRKPDVRKLVPLTAAVAGFIVLLAVSLAYIDITNPLPNPFR